MSREQMSQASRQCSVQQVDSNATAAAATAMSGGFHLTWYQQPLDPRSQQPGEERPQQQQQSQHPCYNMGRDSAGALLDMLAEVASQTLHSEKKLIEMDNTPPRQMHETPVQQVHSPPVHVISTPIRPIQQIQHVQHVETTTIQPAGNIPIQVENTTRQSETKTRDTKRKSQQVIYNVQQLLTMPATQMVKFFTNFNSDELRKQYSYTCALVPGCGQCYTSFASESRARVCIRAHLAEHLEFLKNNAETYASFTATAVKSARPKSTVQNKKTKVQQTKKPLKETLNKENKDTTAGKTTNYLRKILSNEVNLKDLENNTAQDKINDLQNLNVFELKKEVLDVKVLGDHSYYEPVKEDSINQESACNINRVPVNTMTNENIVVMVVESNGVCRGLRDSLEAPENSLKQSKLNDNEINNMTLRKEESFTAPDNFVPAKPKGKAKFIGTSKEEREMALILIEKIRKKGNPTGNNLQCRICDPPRSFTAPTTLVSHYRSHAGIKPYECRICRAVFTRRHSLKYHMLIHQNQTRFTCSDCGKKFRHPSHFREHRRRHTGEAPFGCEDCGQRFKTRNTYKRHLKTRHGKVLTITGELLHLSEEDSKKVKTKSRKKKETPINTFEAVNPTDVMIDHTQNQGFTWEQQQICNNVDETGVQECIDNAIWMYPNQPTVDTEENYSEIQNKSPINKTEYNETEIENNFENGEVVIAQTDSDGTLHFENYNYAQDTVYTDSNTIEFSCEQNVCTEIIAEETKEYENQEESIVEYQECTDNYTEEMNPIFTAKTDSENNVFVLDGEEIITPDSVESTELEEFSTPNTTPIKTENQMDTSEEQTIIPIIPYQLKLNDNNGTAMVQLLKNSKFALLGNKGQNLNLAQNGKQQTIYFVTSGNSNNLLEMQNGIIEGSKPLPVIVPAE